MIQIFGIGPGNSEWLPFSIGKEVEKCDVLLGGGRALELFREFEGEKYRVDGDLRSTIETIEVSLQKGKKVGVLVSGDPGFYSLLPLIRRTFSEERLQVFPGIGSLQFAFAKAGVPWQEAELMSVHGRSLEQLPLNLHRPLGLLTGGENSPQRVADYYVSYGFNPEISLGNYLSYENEQWVETTAKDLALSLESYKNAVMILFPEGTQFGKRLNLHEVSHTVGLPDEEFTRGKVPMTKSEIRVQVLAKAQITENSRVLDVGAGTGSISIEAARLAYRGCVFAVEDKSEAQELILVNKEKFQVPNLHLIRGAAPEALQGLPAVDVCIIGGSHGKMEEIIKRAPLVPGGRVVITAVTLETITKGIEALKSLDYQDVDVMSVQAVRWKGLKDFHLAQAINPVFIISGHKGL